MNRSSTSLKSPETCESWGRMKGQLSVPRDASTPGGLTTTYEGSDRMTKRTCSVEACLKPPHSRGWCRTHYSRWLRTGDTGTAEPQLRTYDTPYCEVEGCKKERSGGAMCPKHRTRVHRHGDPFITKKPRRAYAADHGQWLGDDIGYRSAHRRVEYRRGRAIEHLCRDCGKQADDWSYDHTDPRQRFDGLWYSPDPEHYSPRCKPCHRAFDAQHKSLDPIEAT